MPAFSLLGQPWLPCLTLSRRQVEVGLRDVIAHCHEYSELFDPSPLVTVALHRLLLALVRRIYPIGDSADWRALASAGRFDADVADRYFARYADRFDLFDPEHPFMQAKLSADVRRHPGAWLMHEAASGNNPTLFDHSFDAKPRALSPGHAARCLVAVQSAALGGGVSEPFNFCDATLARDCTALVYGGTLFETLLLNSPPGQSTVDDAPIWEWNVMPAPERDGTPVAGEMALFTWPSRRIRLLTDETTGLVNACQVKQGLVPDAGHHDPQKAFHSDQRGNRSALRLTPTRAVWRDLPVWLGSQTDSRCPNSLSWLRTLLAQPGGEDTISTPLQLAVFGLATAPGRAAIFFWRQERYPLPIVCLRDSEALHQVIAALARAEAVSAVLAAALSFLNSLVSAPGDETEMVLTDADVNFWTSLDRGLHPLLLAAASDPVKATCRWNRDVAGAAEEAFATAIARLGRLSGHARSTATAGRFFAQRLAAIMGSPTGSP